jgi:hypothetical protein
MNKSIEQPPPAKNNDFNLSNINESIDAYFGAIVKRLNQLTSRYGRLCKSMDYLCNIAKRLDRTNSLN